RIQYTDYVRWQRSRAVSEALTPQRAYWLERFAGPVPRLSLPTNRPRPAAQRLLGRRLAFRIDAPALSRVKALASEEHASSFIVLLALTSVYLGRLTRQHDIVIGIPVAGRSHPDLEAIVGMFVNTLAVRIRLDPARS